MLQDAGLGPLPSPHLGAPGGPGAPGPAPEARLGPGSQDHAGPVLGTSGDSARPSRAGLKAGQNPRLPGPSGRGQSPAPRARLGGAPSVHAPNRNQRPASPEPRRAGAGRRARHRPHSASLRAHGSLAENFPPQLPRPPTHLGRRGSGGGGRPRGQAGAGTSQAPPQQPGAAGGDALKGTAAPPPDAVFFRRAVASAPLGPVQVALGPAGPPPLRGTKGQGALQPGPARLPPAGDPGRGTAGPASGRGRGRGVRGGGGGEEASPTSPTWAQVGRPSPVRPRPGSPRGARRRGRTARARESLRAGGPSRR